jgi:phage protein U
MSILMQLGPVQFSIRTRAFQTLEREVSYRWPTLERLGRRPAHQWLGIGEETLAIKGVVYPTFNPGGQYVGIGQIDALRSLGAQGAPQDLITGTGEVWGKWVVKSVKETRTEFVNNGAPRKQEFSMDLVFYGDQGFGMEGVLFAGGVFFVPRFQAGVSVSVNAGGFSFNAGASIGIG